MQSIFIRPLSDLHCEFKEFDYSYEGEHVLALAGDINTGTKGLCWANKLEVMAHDLDDVHICYVTGNHEYYGTNIPENDRSLKELAERHVYVLNNSDVEINGVNFLGATLWTDMDGMGNKKKSVSAAQFNMSDYKKITRPKGQYLLQPEDTIALHEESVRWLDKRMTELKGRPIVVMTHHAPSKQSITPEHANNVLSAAFFSNLEHLITKHQPRLWIHGHTHNSADYRIGNTRVVCNPRGYPNEYGKNGFKPDKIIGFDYKITAVNPETESIF